MDPLPGIYIVDAQVVEDCWYRYLYSQPFLPCRVNQASSGE